MKTLERYWPVVSILSVLALLASLFFWPSASATLAVLILILSLGMAILFIVRRQMQVYGAGQIDRADLFRNIFFEVLGFLLAMALAIVLVQVVTATMTHFMGRSLVGFVIVMVAAVLTGLGASWLVQVTWGRLVSKV